MAGEDRAPSIGAARTVAVLSVKYLADTLKSPAMVTSMLIPLVLMVGLDAILGGKVDVPEADLVFSSNIAAYAVLFECVMVVSMAVLYAMAEEREKHLLRTLSLAGVRLGHVVAARGIVATVLIVAGSALCLAALGAPAHLMAPLLLVSVVGSLPLVLVSLALGLFARTQMSVMVLDSPLVLVAVLPMLFVYDETLVHVTPFLPTGGLHELTLLLWGGGALAPEASLSAAVLPVWIAIGIVALAVALRKAPREA